MLKRRIALITGASRGIGRATAIQLANDGMFVVVNYLRQDARAAETCEQIRQKGGEAVPFRFDVGNREEVQSAVKSITDKYGLIDVLVNNAAIIRVRALIRVKQRDWDEIFSTNIVGVHNCTHAVVKTWVGRRCGSRIINLTSVGGEQGYRDSSTYCASKAAVIGFSKALAKELASKGVTVNIVSPGAILTEAWEIASGTDILKQTIEQTPLGEAGNPEDVAYLVGFLASEEASYITGQLLRVNGGLYM